MSTENIQDNAQLDAWLDKKLDEVLPKKLEEIDVAVVRHTCVGDDRQILVETFREIGDRADIAVHSMKDVPVELPTGLHLAVILQEMVAPVVSGVSFSRNPISGEAEIIVEAVEGPGAALVQHPGVDKVAFTGSTETAQLINRAMATNNVSPIQGSSRLLIGRVRQGERCQRGILHNERADTVLHPQGGSVVSCQVHQRCVIHALNVPTHGCWHGIPGSLIQ